MNKEIIRTGSAPPIDESLIWQPGCLSSDKMQELMPRLPVLREEYLVFATDSQAYAVATRTVSEIIWRVKIKPSQDSLDFPNLGSFALRDRTVPILDIQRAICSESPKSQTPECVVVVSAGSNEIIGLPAKTVKGVLRIPFCSIMTSPDYSRAADFVLGLASSSDGAFGPDIVVLESDRLPFQSSMR